MKEATGEVSMTIVTLVAIAVIGAILAANWGKISNYISELWNPNNANNKAQCTGAKMQWDEATQTCIPK